jgi:hypothetical protein
MNDSKAIKHPWRKSISRSGCAVLFSSRGHVLFCGYMAFVFGILDKRIAGGFRLRPIFKKKIGVVY